MGLAGVKRKQRISADPQNKSWRNDTEKFGYKMLTKMGWSEGKGLGVHEDGAMEQPQVEYKSDTRGLGITKKDAAVETYQQLTTFDSILRRVGAETAVEGFPDVTESLPDKKQSTERKGRKRKKLPIEQESSSSGSDANSNSEPDGASDSEKRAPQKTKRIISGRLAHRHRFIKNKRVDMYSASQMKEILGVDA